jgi:plastocyanin
MPRRPTVGPSGGVCVSEVRDPTSIPNLPKAFDGAKVTRHERERGLTYMSWIQRVGLAIAALTAVMASLATAQATHMVRMIANPANHVYRFEPAEVVAAPGDVLVFQAVSGAPHSVVFESEGLSPGVRGAFNTAMPSRSGDLSSTLVVASGNEYRMTVPQVPPGTYPYYCLPHRAYDMRGVLRIK